ncbi:MAG: Jag N-terminal domain-containing protein, partial [Rubrobacteraceae bacterium]|nr:Jag N-terminal domain-containing protein [Rubrobacteraceae bacterium]
MTDDREFYAATVDEAVERAAADLGLPTEEVSYKVLDEGNTGFLGIGARDARIVVETQVTEPPNEMGETQPVAEAEPPETSEGPEGELAEAVEMPEPPEVSKRVDEAAAPSDA